MKTKSLLSIFLSVFFISFNSNAQDGVLDTTFGNQGLVKLANGTFDDKFHDMVVQPDGKIVLAGASFINTYDFIVTRLNSDGSLDNTFGNNGIVVLPIGPENQGELTGDKAFGISLTPDNRIVVVGETYNGTTYNVGIVKLLSNGALDNTFGSNGMASIPISSADAYPRSCTVDDKSNIYVTGGAYSSNQLDVFVLKCDRYGQLDASFGGTGIVVHPVYSLKNDMANKILLDKNDKILLAGTAYNTTNEDYLVMRFNKNGTLDTSFSEDGIEVLGFFGSFNEQCYGMAIQEDEKIVLVGHSNNSFYDVIITRLNTDGITDLGFGTSGIMYTDHGLNVDTAQATDVIIQPDKKIIVGGLAWLNQRGYYAMTRYSSTGVLDTTFGNNGFVYTNFTGTSDDQALAIALQEDGKILLAGQTYDGQGMMSVARYNNPSVLAPLSVNELTRTSISVWPNPTEGEINLQGIEDEKIEVYDLSGRLVLTLSNTNNHTVDLSALNKGLYIIKASSTKKDSKEVSIPVILN